MPDIRIALGYLQRRKHLAFFLPVYEGVMVLHRDEWRELVGDGIICKCKSTRQPMNRHTNEAAAHSAWRGLGIRNGNVESAIEQYTGRCCSHAHCQA